MASSTPACFPRMMVRSLFGVVVAAALGAATVACGVGFGSGPDGTETFESLTVEGPLLPGAQLSLVLEYEQQYPVAVNVACEVLRDGEEKRKERVLTRFLETPLAANPDGGPVGEATPVPGRLEQTFTAPDRPGHYFVECFTVEDDNNFIVEAIDIGAAEAEGG